MNRRKPEPDVAVIVMVCVDAAATASGTFQSHNQKVEVEER